ncbi:MAG: hypothetical protein EOM24_32440 [Chloroflexia bacterium]|nr:hypothetical protein [Chloroflexia bacterium]
MRSHTSLNPNLAARSQFLGGAFGHAPGVIGGQFIRLHLGEIGEQGPMRTRGWSRTVVVKILRRICISAQIRIGLRNMIIQPWSQRGTAGYGGQIGRARPKVCGRSSNAVGRLSNGWAKGCCAPTSRPAP